MANTTRHALVSGWLPHKRSDMDLVQIQSVKLSSFAHLKNELCVPDVLYRMMLNAFCPRSGLSPFLIQWCQKARLQPYKGFVWEVARDKDKTDRYAPSLLKYRNYVEKYFLYYIISKIMFRVVSEVPRGCCSEISKVLNNLMESQNNEDATNSMQLWIWRKLYGASYI